MTDQKLTVWYGPMPESNGRTNWTAILHKGKMSEGFTIARSEYPGRVRYEADGVRWLIGELDKRPFILDYDGDERTPCHLCGGSGVKDGKPCWGLNFTGPVHDIDTADYVKHGPTGETWVVARVNGKHLHPCGWPPTRADLSDCTLVKKATQGAREKLLRELANGQTEHAGWAAETLGVAEPSEGERDA